MIEKAKAVQVSDFKNPILIISQDIKMAAIADYIANNYILIPLNGKIPAIKNWTNAAFNPNFSTIGNYGVVLQEDDLIIDYDPRNDIKANTPENSLSRLFKKVGYIPSFSVKTGGGGFHIYFKKPVDIKVVGELKNYPGVEFKTNGQQVVGVGSIHPETNKMYIITDLSREGILC